LIGECDGRIEADTQSITRRCCTRRTKRCGSIASTSASEGREPLTDDLSMDRQLRGLSENRQQFGEYWMLLDLLGPPGLAGGDVADFHFSDIPVRGDDGARAIGANDDAAAVELRGRRRQGRLP